MYFLKQQQKKAKHKKQNIYLNVILFLRQKKGMSSIASVLQGYDQHALVLNAEIREIEGDIQTLKSMSRRYSHDGAGFMDSIRFLAHLRDVKKSASTRIMNERQNLLSSCVHLDMDDVDNKASSIPSPILDAGVSAPTVFRPKVDGVFTNSAILRHSSSRPSSSLQSERRGGSVTREESANDNIIYVNTPSGVAAFESRILSNRKSDTV